MAGGEEVTVENVAHRGNLAYIVKDNGTHMAALPEVTDKKVEFEQSQADSEYESEHSSPLIRRTSIANTTPV